MDTQEILKKIFPDPNASFAGWGGLEVNGLARGTVPQNCEILSSGLLREHVPGRSGRQEHYLVRIDEALVYTRICEAMPGSGYAEYAVVFDVAFTDEEKRRLTERANRFMEACCIPKA